MRYRLRFWRSWSLRLQLTVLVVVLLLALLAALGFFLDLRLNDYIESSTASSLAAAAAPIMSRPQHPPPKTSEPPSESSGKLPENVDLTRLARDLGNELNGPDSFATVTTPDGSIVVPPPPPGQTEPPRTAPRLWSAAQIRATISAGKVSHAVLPSQDQRYVVVFVPVATRSGVIGVAVLGRSLASGDELLAALRILFVAGALVGALVAGVAAHALVGLTLAPLGRVVDATDRVAGGDWSVRVGSDAPSNELGHLARAFDRMVERLERVFEAQRRFVADASHELRTPLTALGGMVEMLDLGIDREDPRARERILRALSSEIDRMAGLVTSLLTLTGIERGAQQLSPVRLDEVIATLRPVLEALAGDHPITLELRPTPAIEGNRDQLGQVVVNLVENAAKYTPSGKAIGVRVETIDRNVILKVWDAGVGISPDAISHLFERFYRADASRARQTGGFGLGLAIAQAIVTAHSGTIDVVSGAGAGTTVTIRLPIILPPHGAKL